MASVARSSEARETAGISGPGEGVSRDKASRGPRQRLKRSTPKEEAATFAVKGVAWLRGQKKNENNLPLGRFSKLLISKQTQKNTIASSSLIRG